MEPWKIALYMCGGLIALWVVFVGAERGDKWEGESQVSMFPIGAEAKNYRLASYTYAETIGSGLFSNKDTYVVELVVWPNGGSTTFSSCHVTEGERNLCATEEGKGYFVEVTEPPEKPKPE